MTGIIILTLFHALASIVFINSCISCRFFGFQYPRPDPEQIMAPRSRSNAILCRNSRDDPHPLIRINSCVVIAFSLPIGSSGSIMKSVLPDSSFVHIRLFLFCFRIILPPSMNQNTDPLFSYHIRHAYPLS